ncbi:unnamed protein product [Prorocentrum cordatum]|uniref:Casein kinase I n=1 Tax=Prorocentrum cordatum TaxID=2364126 RepID=A0ABN9WRB3_9DINO|nr:unnamed protein product [Polarella glacialis]
MAAASNQSDEEEEGEEETVESYSYSYEEHEGSSSSAAPVKPRKPKLVGGRYEVGSKLGAGSYSEVFEAVDKKSGKVVAVKMEWQKAEKTDKLLWEAELYKELQHGEGIPRVRWVGSQGEYNMMVLDVLGPSLDDLFKKQRRFSVKTVVMIAKQVITRLEFVHNCGVLYRDIKPHNFLIGVGEEVGRIYLVDFGLSKRYLDATTGDHYKCKIEKGRGIAGTVRYSSPFLHDGYEASRRDVDLFALGYVLMHLLRGDLPWLDISHKDKKVRNKRIGQKKAETSDKELCSGFPSQFVDYFRYMRSVGFYDKPDYNRLQAILDKVLKELKLKNDLVYDWSEDNDARPKKKRKLDA